MGPNRNQCSHIDLAKSSVYHHFASNGCPFPFTMLSHIICMWLAMAEAGHALRLLFCRMISLRNRMETVARLRRVPAHCCVHPLFLSAVVAVSVAFRFCSSSRIANSSHQLAVASFGRPLSVTATGAAAAGRGSGGTLVERKTRLERDGVVGSVRRERSVVAVGDYHVWQILVVVAAAPRWVGAAVLRWERHRPTQAGGSTIPL